MLMALHFTDLNLPSMLSGEPGQDCVALLPGSREKVTILDTADVLLV